MHTKTCDRCGGIGEYSYNLIHGKVCFKCWGKGIVLANPRAKGCKPTAQMQYADVGDVVQVQGAGTCKVVEVMRGEFKRHGITYPECVIFESLIDGKRYNTRRHTPVTEKMIGGKMHRVNRLTNVWYAAEEVSK